MAGLGKEQLVIVMASDGQVVTPFTAVSSVITKGDGQIFFDSLKNNTYGM